MRHISQRNQHSHPSDYAVSLADLGKAYLREGRYKDAISALSYTQRLAPSHNNVIYLALALLNSARAREAVDLLQNALGKNPSCKTTKQNLATALFKIGRKKESRELCREILDSPITNPIDPYIRSAALLTIGWHRDALAEYATAWTMAPQFARNYHFLHAALEEKCGRNAIVRALSKKIGAKEAKQTSGSYKHFKLRLLIKTAIASIACTAGLSPLLAFLPQASIYLERISEKIATVQPAQYQQARYASPQNATPSPTASLPQAAYRSGRLNEGNPGFVTDNRGKEQTHQTQYRENRQSHSTPYTSRAPSGASGGGSTLISVEKRPQKDKDKNVKLGIFSSDITFVSGVTFDDNVYLSNLRKEADMIISSGIEFDSTITISEGRDLDFTLGAFYYKYLDHKELDSTNNFMTLTPDTELAFEMKISNIDLRLYDQLRFDTSPLDLRSINVAGTTTGATLDRFARFTNKAGIDASWAGKKSGIELGVSRQDLIPIDGSYNFTRYAEYNFPLGYKYQLAKNKEVGIDFAYLTREWHSSTNGYSNHDGQGIDIIPKFTWLATSRLRLDMAAGVSMKFFDDNGTSLDTNDRTSIYYSLTATHQPNRKFKHTAMFTRFSTFGLATNVSEITLADYEYHWAFIRDWLLRGNIQYLTSRGTGPNGARTVRFSNKIGLAYKPSKNIDLAVDYRFMNNHQDDFIGDDFNNFTQNRVDLTFRYDF